MATEPLFEVREMSAEPLVLTHAQMAVLWDRMKRFPILFATTQETSFDSFRDVLEDPQTILLSLRDGAEQTGLAMVYDIEPGIEASIQVSFFDQKFKDREALMRQFVRWVFDTLRVRRVSARIRADARYTISFYERVGLYFEGVLKSWIRVANKLHDLHLYGITENECDDLWLKGHSWAKPRVKPLESSETH